MPSDSSNSRRVVITGMGAVTNLATTARGTWESMREGRSGISLIEGAPFEEFDPAHWAVRIGGQIKGWDPSKWVEPREAKRLDRSAILGLYAAGDAVEDSGIDFSKEDPELCGVCVGSGVGGIWTIEMGKATLDAKGPHRMSPFTVPKLMANAATGNISIRFGLLGPATTHVTACASSGHSMSDAVNTIRRGDADVMLSGGTEAACTPLCVGAFMTMKALSTRNDEPERASRPFDRDRDGFVLGEGAAIFVLEAESHAKARGANILGEIVGCANSADASHITAPDPEGRGAMRSMKWALRDAGLNPDQVDYVNAHGTSTPLGDAAEVRAVSALFGDHALASRGGRLMMSSTKSMHGHALGASGALETIACLHACSDGVVPPTINLDAPDEDFDLDFVANTSRERPVKYAMNNTFGFGGHNVTLIIGRYEG